MLYNQSFTSYRRGESGGIRSYSGTITITNGACYLEPARDELVATLGLGPMIEVYSMLTEEDDINVNDRLVINSVNYHVEGRSQQEIGGRTITRIILSKKRS